jgi:hypothetical protein
MNKSSFIDLMLHFSGCDAGEDEATSVFDFMFRSYDHHKTGWIDTHKFGHDLSVALKR